MSLKSVRGKDLPQDLQRTAACVQRRHGMSLPPQEGHVGILGARAFEKKEIMQSLRAGRRFLSHF
jgi:hypothetical protein